MARFRVTVHHQEESQYCSVPKRRETQDILLRNLTQFLFLPSPSRTSRMKYKLEKEEKIRHYQIFNIACEMLSSFQSDKTTDFSSILCFAGSFPGAKASCFKGELLQRKYNSPQPLGERIAYYNGTTGNVLQQLEKLFCNIFFFLFSLPKQTLSSH